MFAVYTLYDNGKVRVGPTLELSKVNRLRNRHSVLEEFSNPNV